LQQAGLVIHSKPFKVCYVYLIVTCAVVSVLGILILGFFVSLETCSNNPRVSFKLHYIVNSNRLSLLFSILVHLLFSQHFLIVPPQASHSTRLLSLMSESPKINSHSFLRSYLNPPGFCLFFVLVLYLKMFKFLFVISIRCGYAPTPYIIWLMLLFGLVVL
jgi:hypothetical protein